MTRRPPWRRIFGYDPQGRWKAVALLVAVLALAPLVGSAVTAGAASSRVTNDRTFDKGNAAALSFDRTTAKTCADGSAGNDLVSAVLVARQNVTRSDGTELATKSLFLNVNRRDTCTDSHTASFGSLEDAGVVYEQSKTDAANVSGVIPMQDILTGAPAGAAAVDTDQVQGNVLGRDGHRLDDPERR